APRRSSGACSPASASRSSPGKPSGNASPRAPWSRRASRARRSGAGSSRCTGEGRRSTAPRAAFSISSCDKCDKIASEDRENRMSEIVVGAVAYDPKAVAIWEAIRDLFRERPRRLDYVLYSNYESQVDALFRGHIHVAWNTPVAYVKAKRRAEGRVRVLAM